jgi:hypothetical protein
LIFFFNIYNLLLLNKMHTFENCKKSYTCKACDKIWYGNSKKRVWELHCETNNHKNMINAIKISGKDNKYINTSICYEEFDFGLENTLRIGILDEE